MRLLIATSYDADEVRRWRRQFGYTHEFLPDAGALIAAYGVRDGRTKQALESGIPVASAFVIAPDGALVYRWIGTKKDRADLAEVYAAVDAHRAR